MDGPLCQRCGKILNDDARLCGDCMLRPPVFSRNVSYGLYKGALRDMILLYKYGELYPLGRRLAGYLAGLAEIRLDGGFDCIVTVPPDPSRRRERDHLAILGGIVGRMTGIPFQRKTLVKRRATDPQSTLPLARRLRNLDNVFELRRPNGVSGKRVLLVDDVFTTGTTITRCAERLVAGGAIVTALTLARSV